MKTQNYCQWNNPNISDEEWNKMLEEQDFSYPDKYSSLIEYIKNASDKELDHVTKELDRLETENEKERQKQLSIMKEFFHSIGVQCMHSTYTLKEMKEKWKNTFCASLTKEEQAQCYMDEFMWHVFSYRKITPVLLGDKAKQKFDGIKKKQVYVFTENGERVYFFSFPDTFQCYMLRLVYSEDVYFVDSDFRWTFVLPHDYDCMFYENPNMDF